MVGAIVYDLVAAEALVRDVREIDHADIDTRRLAMRTRRGVPVFVILGVRVGRVISGIIGGVIVAIAAIARPFMPP